MDPQSTTLDHVTAADGGKLQPRRTQATAITVSAPGFRNNLGGQLCSLSRSRWGRTAFWSPDGPRASRQRCSDIHFTQSPSNAAVSAPQRAQAAGFRTASGSSQLRNRAAQQVQRRQSGSRREPLTSGGSAGGRRGGRRSRAGLRRFPTSAACEPSKGGRREHEKGLLAGISCLLCDPAALPAMVGPESHHTR